MHDYLLLDMDFADFPKDFVNRVLNDSFLGIDLLKALSEPQPTSIRTSPTKNFKHWESTKPIPWSQNGLFLEERPVFTLDPHFHAGAYYSQEAGSQFIDWVIRNIDLPIDPVILDLAAAPGGKSSLILGALNGKGLLVSNEINRSRAGILKENIIKWGAFNNVVTSNEPKHFESFPNLFDCILLDAPCSGEGMFRKDLGARNEWSESNVILCANRQKEIITAIWNSLKPGGILIYSTCTFNALENEDTVAWVLNEFEAKQLKMKVPFAKSGRNEIGHYALPNLLQTEGFYFCAIQKINSNSSSTPRKNKFKSEITSLNSEVWHQEWVQNSPEIQLVQWQNYQFVIPTLYVELIQQIHEKLHVIKLGTEIGEPTRKGFIPNPALAFDTQIQSSNIEKIELTKEQALSYLKGETFHLPGKVGYALVTFEGSILGWIKHLGNRFNNLYPKEYRIRMRID